MEKLKMSATKTLTFQEGCEKYLEYCRQRNLREGTINHYMSLAEEQIKSAFMQSEKEVADLHTRISQGMRESKKKGNKIALTKGTTLVTDKSIKCKEIIKKHALDFGGTLSDKEVLTMCKISRNSYYKYKRKLKNRNVLISL